MANINWTEDQDQYLIENYKGTPLAVLVKFLNKTEDAIRWRASYLHVTKPKGNEWSTDDIEYLKKNKGNMTYQDLAYYLGRTKSAVANKILDLNIISKRQSKSEDVESGIPYSGSITRQYVEKVSTMEVGDSFLFPISDRQILRNAIKSFPERYFRTKKVDDFSRRVWRLF